jgi:hypothetical protein
LTLVRVDERQTAHIVLFGECRDLLLEFVSQLMPLPHVDNTEVIGRRGQGGLVIVGRR